MFSQQTLKRFVDYLLKINESERLLQTLRQNFGRNSYFQVETAFARFDKFSKGVLVPADFSEFMLENGIYPTQEQLYLVFKDFDKRHEGFITIDIFEQSIIPKQNAQLKNDILSRKFYIPHSRLQEDLEFMIGKYFQAKLDNYRSLNEIRVQIMSDPAFTVAKAFVLLEKKGTGIIQTKQDIDSFLRKNGKALRAQQLRRIYQGLDFHRPGPITLDRFEQHLDPFLRGFYPAYQVRVQQKVQLKELHAINSVSRRRLEQQRIQNQLEEERISRDYLKLRSSNQTLGRVLQNQYIQNEIERSRVEESLSRSRRALLQQEQLLRLQRLRAKQQAFLARSYYRPYPYI